MRLLKEVPSAAASIRTGALNLSTVSTVQCFLKREERDKGKIYSSDEKRELLDKMENLSVRECEKILFQVSPGSAKSKETSKAISNNETELRVVVSDELMKKFEKIKGLVAHSYPKLSMAQLDPDRKNERRKKRKESKDEKAADADTTPQTHSTPAPESGLSLKQSPRYIPAAIRSEVWARDKGKCTFVSLETGKRCESRHGLQYDHKIPLALGGQTELSNLRILCSRHNSWEAIQKIGHATMKRYIPNLG